MLTHALMLYGSETLRDEIGYNNVKSQEPVSHCSLVCTTTIHHENVWH